MRPLDGNDAGERRGQDSVTSLWKGRGVTRLNDETLDSIVNDLLRVGTIDDDTAEAAYAASRLAEESFEDGWRLLSAAFDRAASDLQLQYIAACILEPLFRSFPGQTSAAALDRLRDQPRFGSVLAAARLSGVPPSSWVPVNAALRAAGVPEKSLVLVGDRRHRAGRALTAIRSSPAHSRSLAVLHDEMPSRPSAAAHAAPFDGDRAPGVGSAVHPDRPAPDAGSLRPEAG